MTAAPPAVKAPTVPPPPDTPAPAEPADAVEAGDAELVDRVAGGDRAALAELAGRYQAGLFAYTAHLTGSRELAEEVLQETWLATWRAAGSFQGGSSVRTWVIGIARHQASKHLRGARLALVKLDDAPAVAEPAPGPEDQAIAAADAEAVAAAMGRLSLPHREALELFFLDDLSHAEVAEITETPVGTVKSRLANAKHQLAAALTRQGGPR
jgi:RNA polymerase sigma-70 factor (ECF subfamily)